MALNFNAVKELFNKVKSPLNPETDAAKWATDVAKVIFETVQKDEGNKAALAVFEGFDYQGFNPKAMTMLLYSLGSAANRSVEADMFYLIVLFYLRGANIDRIAAKIKGGEDWKREFSLLVSTYGIKARSNTTDPTLPRISQCFPMMGFVAFTVFGTKLNYAVTTSELGANVPNICKLNFYPALLSTTNGNTKAKLGLILYNLYQAKLTIKTMPAQMKKDRTMTIDKAFSESCKFSYLAYTGLEVDTLRKSLFSQFISRFDITPQLVSTVWSNLIGRAVLLDDSYLIEGVHDKISNNSLTVEFLEATFPGYAQEQSNVTNGNIINGTNPAPGT